MTAVTKVDVPVLFGVSCIGSKQDFYVELPQEPDKLQQELEKYGDDAKYCSFDCFEPYNSEVDAKLEKMIESWASDGLEKLNERLIKYYQLDNIGRNCVYARWFCDKNDLDYALDHGDEEVEYIPYEKKVEEYEYRLMNRADWDQTCRWLGSYLLENCYYFGSDGNVTESFMERYIDLELLGSDYVQENCGEFFYDPDSKTAFFAFWY